MKNYWTDQRALKKYIESISRQVGNVCGCDPKVIEEVITEDMKENPPTEKEFDMIRTGSVEVEVTQKITYLDDGLW